MAQNLITAITDIPAIAQNVIGGAVFALVLYFGQKLFRYSADKTTTFNNTLRAPAKVPDVPAKLAELKAERDALKAKSEA